MIFKIYNGDCKEQYICGDIESCCVELMERLQKGEDIYMVTIRKEKTVCKKFDFNINEVKYVGSYINSNNKKLKQNKIKKRCKGRNDS